MKSAPPSFPPALVLAVILATTASACSSSPPGSAGPGTTPQASPGPTLSDAIDHPTGRTEVVLRVEEGGGFVGPGVILTQAPEFTLYGDGTVIFRDPSTPPPQPIGTVQPLPPFKTARLSEEQVQTLLKFAVGPGGLGIARAHYDPGTVADAPTTTFTLSAGGLTKTVSAEALGLQDAKNPDAPILAALAALRDRLATFADEIGGGRDWSPDRYRGILTEGGVNAPIPWPWKSISETDFMPSSDPDRPSFPTRVLSRAEVDELGLTGIGGGFQGLVVVAPSGKVYSMALRPLLPDEKD
jgi:hypothetical protein